ncbi:unnamed protein product [Fraxinus pennsylvanica]|uniref:NAC domain-containing protein n=1 Tax=Fraxinus pennsylvanica TaxID=56036 RepID=A0AAD1ZEX2_9LAMI|nr:unnamed protein product [Fraxinus pennsylvanica]
MVGRTCTELPPGFRFHPTDEELIMCYLRNQASSRPCPVSIIPEVDIYKFDPWELPEKAEVGENEWPPKGIKTDWIMHEYRLNESRSRPTLKQNGSMRLDDWVLCRIYKKKNFGRATAQIAENHFTKTVTTATDASTEPQTLKFPRPSSLTHLWEFDYLGSISQLFSDSTSHNATFNINQAPLNSNGNSPSIVEKYQLGKVQQPTFVNPDLYELQGQTWS